MNQLPFFLCRGFCAGFLFLLPFSGLNFANAANTGISDPDFAVITGLHDLRKAISRTQGYVCAFDLSATVLGSDGNSGTLFLQDASGTEILETGHKGVVLHPGQQPSRWTLGRLVVMVVMLIVGLSLAFVWIMLLRRQVERRTIQLKREINERERAEQGRIIEVERSRIARDLHDDLGSQLTGLSMIASVSPGLKLTHEQYQKRMLEIANKSRFMAVALDRLVWAIDSKNDTLSAMVEYLASYVEEFLAKTEIAVRLELPTSYQEQIVVAEIRNHVLLSVSEVLNNAVRHGRPTEVLLRLVLQKNELEILIQDNGCGFESSRGSLGNGLANLHERMSQLNGQCQITSFPGKGTSVLLKLPLCHLPNETSSPSQ